MNCSCNYLNVVKYVEYSFPTHLYAWQSTTASAWSACGGGWSRDATAWWLAAGCCGDRWHMRLGWAYPRKRRVMLAAL